MDINNKKNAKISAKIGRCVLRCVKLDYMHVLISLVIAAT